MTSKKQSDESDVRPGEFSSAISQICDEKGIPKDKVIETIEAALAAAYKKDYGKKSQNIRAEFEEVSGGAKFFLVKEVVDETTREFVVETEEDEDGEDAKKKEVKKEKIEEEKESAEEEEKLSRFNPERDITLEDAKKIKKGAKVGDIIETELEEQEDYGRIAAQTAKQVIIQRIREAERDAMYEEYKEKEGEVISGTVQRIEGHNVFIDLGKSTGILFPSEQIEGENYRVGQRIKVYLAKVESDAKGPGVTLSRTHPDMIKKLFELEVPEIFAGTVEIKAVSREAGARSKVAVASEEDGIDPIGSCVGQKGTRVQAIIDELGGEKIDIIEWNEEPDKFISAALSPAKVISIDIKEDEKKAAVYVPEDQLSLAIGKRGQNVRLAAKLTEWKIDVFGENGDEDSEDEEQDLKEKEIKKNEKKEKNDKEVSTKEDQPDSDTVSEKESNKDSSDESSDEKKK